MPAPPLEAILLIDDNPNDRLLVRRELNREFQSLTIYEVIDSEGFSQALQSTNFDLVITDYQLGWSNGIEILRMIKAKRPQCPVIMFTNTGTQEIAVEAMKSGLDDYVIKSPQHFIRLCQAIRSVWQQFQTQLRAKQLEGRLQAILNQLEIGIFRAAPSGQLLESNAALLHMLRVESIDAAQDILKTQLALSTSRVPAGPPEIKEIVLHYPEGESLWLRVVATLNLVDAEPIIDGLIEDITARKQVEQQLNQLNETLEDRIRLRTQQLEQSNRELELFAYSVSHDLRSPLRQIDGFIELLRDQLQQAAQDPTVHHYLEVISKLISQAGSMIEALLNFSRTGRVEMNPIQVPMNELVAQVISQLEANQPERRIHWHLSPLPAVWCDLTLMRTVWQNLLENAVKFTRDQPHPEIFIGAQEGSQEVIFYVRDNGVGFNPQQSEKIFGIFQKAHSQQSFEGAGIGLANIQRIILRHGGRVWAESEGDQGATFYFALPNRIKDADKI